MLLVLGALRNVPLWGEMMSEPSYSVLELLPSLQTRSLRGKRVGLHGFGAIAREIVEIFKVHKVRLFAYSAPVPRKFIESLGVSYCATLEELFSQSDILIECESLTAASKGSVSEDVLKLLPEDAVFVNVGRAAVVNESALIRIAREKRLRVAVDVYGEEPANRELLELPNAFLSPHIAGPTSDVYSECGKRALENVARFLNGEEVNGAITPQVYDVST
jgi:phosphoglycerate dehydrogenase-like enzyme